jgi:hypothetical protein
MTVQNHFKDTNLVPFRIILSENNRLAAREKPGIRKNAGLIRDLLSVLGKRCGTKSVQNRFRTATV